MKQPKKPATVKLSPAAVTSPEGIAELMQFREDSLTGQLGGAMARAMKGVGPSGDTGDITMSAPFAHQRSWLISNTILLWHHKCLLMSAQTLTSRPDKPLLPQDVRWNAY